MQAIGVCIAILFDAILRIARSYTTGWSGIVYEYSMAANVMHYYINADPARLKTEWRVNKFKIYVRLASLEISIVDKH